MGSVSIGSEWTRELEERRERARRETFRRGREARSAAARRAGIASGRVRRQLARGRAVPHRRDRLQALALSYPVRQVTRKQHRRLYEARCRHAGLPLTDWALETNYVLYRSLVRWYRKWGQDFETTNPQQARALAKAGRARCTRTVQRHRAVLSELGLIRSCHVRRRGALAGHRDTLRICLLPPLSNRNVTPPAGAGGGRACGPLPPPALPGVAPPHGGRERPPAQPAENSSDEEMNGELAQLDFASAMALFMPPDEPLL